MGKRPTTINIAKPGTAILFLATANVASPRFVTSPDFSHGLRSSRGATDERNTLP